MITGTRENPHFKLKSGEDLSLRPIMGLILNRWEVEYAKANPRPLAPRKVLENGEEWYDVNDPTYLQLLGTWESEHQQASISFVFANGVLNTPPKDFEPMLPAADDKDKKVIWLYSIINTIGENNELEQLINAISGLTEPTPQGIEDAEKN